jgi:urease subunit gamma
MICIKVLVRGEPDAAPFTRVYQYAKDDEQIIEHSIKIVKEKLDRNIPINVNEALLLFVYYVLTEMRAKKRRSTIERNAKAILSSDDVLIGVAETLRIIKLDAVVDGIEESLTFVEPVPAKSYVMNA